MTKLFLKYFLIMGLPFGIIMTMFDLIEGDKFNLLKFVLYTITFGITMTIFFVAFQKHELKKINSKKILILVLATINQLYSKQV